MAGATTDPERDYHDDGPQSGSTAPSSPTKHDELQPLPTNDEDETLEKHSSSEKDILTELNVPNHKEIDSGVLAEDGLIDHDEETESLEPDLIDIPPNVRKIVSFEDDTTLPTLTFRYFLLTIIFIAPGAFISQMVQYRTTYAAYSVFFVQIASHYVGLWLARVLPTTKMRIPFTKFSFSLNPGPWSIKEHVLVTVSASAGATGNLAWASISLSELYYNNKIPAAACIFFMWAIEWLGYSLAAVARQFLLYDPIYPWPQALMQTSLFEAFRKSDVGSKTGRKQKHVFFWCLLALTIWQWFPEYIFPFLSSLSFLCWVAPYNPVANFIGGGLGGMGFLNISLDWSNISSQFGNPMVNPFWASVVLMVSYVFSCWVLLPAAKWGKLGGWHHQLMSNRIFLENGTRYPVDQLLGPNNTFNETAYEQFGPIFMGTHQIWTLFFDYASYISAFTWCALFGIKEMRITARKLIERIKTRGAMSVNHQYTDRLNVIQRSYPEVPIWWYLIMFAISFICIITILAKGLFFIPIWTYFVALLTSIVVVTPMMWLFAISNFQVAIGSFNELLYGYMVNSVRGNKHPAGATAYGAIAGDAWYRAPS